MFNINNDSAVRLQIYLDDNATNHWKKVADVIDNGGWYADTPNDLFYSANCGRSKDYIILNAGPIATFRSDNMIWDFKDLSIREIQAPSDVKSNTVKQLKTNTSPTYNPYIYGNATQEWLDKEHNIKILFTPSPEYPSVGNTTQLSFSVQDSKTGINLRNETATVTVINNFTANIGNGINKGNVFKNISAPNGSLSVKYHFLQAGTHQVIAGIKSKNNVFAPLASFNVQVSSKAGSSNSNGLHNRSFSTSRPYFAHPPSATSGGNISRVVNGKLCIMKNGSPSLINLLTI